MSSEDTKFPPTPTLSASSPPTGSPSRSRPARSAVPTESSARVRRGRPALRHRPHPRRGQGRLAHRPQRPADARLRRRRSASPRSWARGASAATRPSSSTATRTTGGRPTRCGCSRLFGHEDVRLLDGGRAKWVAEGRELTREVPKPDAGGLPGRRARRRADPRVQGRRAGPPRQAAGRRPLPRRVLRRAAAHARLPAGGRDARRPHPRREVGAVGPRGRRGRHVQVSGPTSRRSTSPSRA